jgi:hypothetical protein
MAVARGGCASRQLCCGRMPGIALRARNCDRDHSARRPARMRRVQRARLSKARARRRRHRPKRDTPASVSRTDPNATRRRGCRHLADRDRGRSAQRSGRPHRELTPCQSGADTKPCLDRLVIENKARGVRPSRQTGTKLIGLCRRSHAIIPDPIPNPIPDPIEETPLCAQS